MNATLRIRHATADYPVFVGRGLVDRAAEVVSAIVGSRPVVVVTSLPLAESYGARVAASFTSDVPVLAIPDGETAKTMESVLDLVDRFVERRLARDAVAVIVGGGVVGDVAGFGAAIFLRGIDVVQVPTTLLAQVDSSIGGKVGVNLAQGKNLLGVFHPPRAVLADVDAISTLPRVEVRSGLFESLKAGVIGDPVLFDSIEGDPEGAFVATGTLIEEIVRRSIAVKARIVEEDEHEGDRRRLLNYGHTIGHAIEAGLGYEGLTHGEAVGWGMRAANAVAAGRGLLSASERERIDIAIARLDPREPGAVQPEALIDVIERDKKFRDGRRVMVLPQAVGSCVVCEDVSLDEIRMGIAAVFER